MDILLKVVIGGVVILAITLIAKTKSFAIAGLIPLIPIFAVISHTIIYSELNTVDLKKTILIGIISLIPYLAYLISMYFTVDKLPFVKALVLSLTVWTVLASPILLIQR